MVTERDALLAAILDRPDDDLPRLVYADWLDEYSSSLSSPERESASDRARLIRQQIEQARAEPYSPEWREAEKECRDLISRNYAEWTYQLSEFVVEAGFIRGFIEHVTVEASRFPIFAESMVETGPIREIRATRFLQHDEWESLEPFFGTPQLRRIRRLEFTPGTLVNVEFDALGMSEELTGLHSLSLGRNPVPPPWLTELLAGHRLPALRDLDLSEVTNVGPALADGLERGRHREFTRLNLSGVWFKSSDLKRLLGTPPLRHVEELGLSWDGNPTNPGPLNHLDLAWVIPWGRLLRLDISGQGVGLDGVKEIAWKPEAARLRWMGLASNGVGRGGAMLLVESPYLDLYYLDVRNNELRPRDVERLRHRFPRAEIVA